MPAGRPTKYEPERLRKILDAIRLGAPFYLACNYAGIDQGTFARWREQHPDFADQVKEAEGAAVVGWLAKIEKAANEGSWQAAAWKLERRYPAEFSRLAYAPAGSSKTAADADPLKPEAVFTLKIDRGDESSERVAA